MSAAAQKTLECMEKNGFHVVRTETAAQAREYLAGQIAAEQSVGTGGSMTVRQIGILDALQEKGCTIFTHWGAKPEEAAQMMRGARTADVYLTSANAVTQNGKLVLIDGTGNRVGAVCDGPRKLYFIISQNKLVNGGLDAAISRIKREACPPNASRLGLDTACAHGEGCSAECPNSMCRLTLVVDRVPRGRELTVVWVEEPLGY